MGPDFRLQPKIPDHALFGSIVSSIPLNLENCKRRPEIPIENKRACVACISPILYEIRAIFSLGPRSRP